MHRTTTYQLKMGGRQFSYEFHFVELPTLTELTVLVAELVHDRERAKEVLDPTDDEVEIGYCDDEIAKLRRCDELLEVMSKLPEVKGEHEARINVEVVGTNVGWMHIQPIRSFTRRPE